ncbi:MAG: DUF4469 domain-containing protein [Ardenticatenaceae bacterium]|nr:DUF4469 domain-containing protein [Ardenticatenaceae bacterium]MCB9443372.1 DUF4469 domain-containing protein [Ardenticatenaceae bacterium]
MPIQYALFENNLTSDPDDYMAMVQPVGTADLDMIIERMIQQGSTVTKADTLSVLEDYFTAIESMVVEGMTVITPLANFGASIKGVFNGQTDSFNKARHQISPTVNPGKRLRGVMAQKGQPVKKEAGKPMPNPLAFVDIASDSRNSTLTPGGMGQVAGHRLKFDAADPEQGVFLVDSGGTATRVVTYGRIKPAELFFMVPAGLAAGDYTLEVRAVFASDGPRTGALAAALTVA